MEKETILLTGGAGFIGSKVAKKLLDMGHKVIIYDAFVQYINPLNTAYNDYLRYRFKDINDKVIIERGDTRDSELYRRAIMTYKPSRIIHFAALPIADLANKNSEEAHASIFGGARNALEILRDINFLERFVYISSSMIYGDFQIKPCPEDHPKNPKDLYGGHKYCGEIITETYGRRYDIPYSIVRPSAVYGPTDINRRVSGIFIQNAIEGKPITLHNNGENKLDFTYIEDISDGIIKVMFSKNALGEAFNITYGHGYSIREFAEELKKHFPKLELKFEEGGDNFRPKRGALDISKAKKLVDYNPTYSLEKGIAEYVDFFAKMNK